MPEMIHDETGVIEHVPSRARSIFEQKGWRVMEHAPAAPAPYHAKTAWVEYAESIGVNPTNLTKRQIIEACGEDDLL